VSSIFDGRLFDQCSRLKENYQFPIIILEGNVDEVDSTIGVDFKIPIIPTPNASHTAKLLISLCSRKESIKGPLLKKIKKSNDIQKQQLSILCSMPGVGEKLAIRMLEKFDSPLRVLSASSVDLAKIPGLGEIRAKKIKKMLEQKSKHSKPSNQKTLHDT
jgi:DNA excision repair protein ERCC-4